MFIKLIQLLTVNRYYRMSDDELEMEARRWNIRGYGDSQGYVQRQIIIDALLKKDNSNSSRYAIVISLIAIVISVIALFAN